MELDVSPPAAQERILIVPDEIWMKILAQLEPLDVLALGRSCRRLNKFVDSQEGSKMNPRLSHSNLQFPGTKRPNQPQEPIWAGQPIRQPKPGLKTRYGPWQLLLKKSNKFVWD